MLLTHAAGSNHEPAPSPPTNWPPTCGRKNCIGNPIGPGPPGASTPRPPDSTFIPPMLPAMWPGLPLRTPMTNALPVPGTNPPAPRPGPNEPVVNRRPIPRPSATLAIADMNPEQSNDGFPTPPHWYGLPW